MVLCCKQDCNFNRLLSVPTLFTNYSIQPNSTYDTAAFGSNVVKYLPPTSASQCAAQFPSLANSLNASNPAALSASLASNPSNFEKHSILS